MRKLRLIKVVVQPYFVLDDGETLQEVPIESATVQPHDWPDFPTKQFAEAVASLEQRFNEGDATLSEKQGSD